MIDVRQWNTKGRPSTRWLAIAVVLGLLAGSVWYVNANLNRWFPKNFAQVDSQGLLFRAGMIDAQLIEGVLRDHDIKLVLSMTTPGSTDPDEDRNIQGVVKAAEKLGIRQQFWPLGGDGLGDLEHYIGAVTQMKQAYDLGEPTLVHCSAGSYRTGGVVAIWRLFVDRWPPQRVLDEMHAYGMGRDNRLVAFLNQHMGLIQQRLIEQRVIAEPLPQMPQLPSD